MRWHTSETDFLSLEQKSLGTQTTPTVANFHFIPLPTEYICTPGYWLEIWRKDSHCAPPMEQGPLWRRVDGRQNLMFATLWWQRDQGLAYLKAGATFSLYAFIDMKAWVVWSSFCKWFQRLGSPEKKFHSKWSQFWHSRTLVSVPDRLTIRLLRKGGVTHSPGDWRLKGTQTHVLCRSAQFL